MLSIQRLDARQGDVSAQLNLLRAKLSPKGDIVSEAGRRRTLEVFGEPLSPQQVVERICRDVAHEGLPAVLRYSKSLDRAELTPETIRVSATELARAHAEVDPTLLATVRRIRQNIFDFQQAILHQAAELRRPGVRLRQRYTPLARVGVCVPGGAAAYPSTVLMTVVPALAAGVKQVAVVSPPTANGANNPVVLAVCRELGVEEVYRVGGAQAVAALAYGVEGIPRVDKIVGPGNLFVALAKRHVYGEVDIDSIAGPSEVVVIADDSASPAHLASDMLAQAEHAPGSSVLITTSESLLEAAARELERQVAQLPRCDVTIQSLHDFGCLILASSTQQACAIAESLAPEHLHLAVANPEPLLAQIPSAGAAFLGHYSPVALGDYAAGPSHVLPTGGTARWASGLSANHFLRSSSVIEFDQAALAAISADVMALAEVEGLTAHRSSIAIRLPPTP